MSESLTTLADLITRPEFVIGLVSGAIALLVLFILPRDATGKVPGWGIALAISSAVAINIAVGRNLSLLVGIVLLAIGGRLLESSESRGDDGVLGSAGWTALALGFVVIAWRTGLSEVTWMRLGAPAVGLLAGMAVRSSKQLIPSRIVGPMVAITAFGVWTTVPDTEIARVLLGASLPMALGTLPVISGRLAGAGTFSLVTMIAWVAAAGGESRPASVIGGWACLGLLVLAPVAASRFASGARSGRLMFLHAVLVLVAARVIGLWQSALPALIAVVALASVGSFALFLIQREPSAGT